VIGITAMTAQFLL